MTVLSREYENKDNEDSKNEGGEEKDRKEKRDMYDGKEKKIALRAAMKKASFFVDQIAKKSSLSWHALFSP